jgi:hypothetical protein
MRWTGCVAFMGEMTIEHKILVTKLKERKEDGIIILTWNIRK